jgi:hypothetical protein
MTKIPAAIVGALIGLILPMQLAFADGGATPGPLSELTAEWWQWALSIPTDQNPQTDASGQYCMVGQRGPIWFLAGVFGGGPPVARTCSVPEGTTLFFPITNAINFNTPNVCGQGSDNLTVKEMRAFSKTTIDGTTDLSIQVNGKPANKLMQRIASQVFEVALPEENVFDGECSGLGGVPAGIYSPAVDDGYYVTLGPLKQGTEIIHFQAAAGPGGADEDVTYTLTVVPVLTK